MYNDLIQALITNSCTRRDSYSRSTSVTESLWMTIHIDNVFSRNQDILLRPCLEWDQTISMWSLRRLNLERHREHRHRVSIDQQTDWIRSRIQRLIKIQDRGRPNRRHHRHRPLESGKARTDGHGTDRGQVQNVIVHPNLIFQTTKHRNRRKKLKRIMGQHFQNCQI